MKSIVLTFLILSIYFNVSAQILPGQAPMGPSDEFLIGVRYRNLTLGSPLSGNEKYLGVPDLGIAAQRVESALVYASTQLVSFTYNAMANNITCVTTIGASSTTLTMNNISSMLSMAGKLRTLNQMNVFQIRIRNRTPSSTTTVSGITLNSMPVPGIFSVSGNNNTQFWFAFFSGYNTTFNLTASIQLSGTYTGTGENNVVEFLWGSSIQVLPITIQNTTITSFNSQNFINYEIPNYSSNLINKSVLEGSSDGHNFRTIDSTTAIGKYNTFKYPQSNGITFFRVCVFLQNGERKYSVILKAINNTIGKPYKIYYQSNAISLVSFYGAIQNITVYDKLGKIMQVIQSNHSNTKIPIENYAKGVYYIHFQMQQKKYVERIVR